LEPFEKFTDWEQFQNLASNLILPWIDSGVEADKAVSEFTLPFLRRTGCRPVRLTFQN
jgi:hypothetical protein